MNSADSLKAAFGQFADPARLVADSFSAFLPIPRQSVAEWAAEKRWMNNPGGGYTGLWNHDMAPYLVKPMESLTSPDHLITIFVGPAQSGKTTLAENWLGASIETEPADFLWYMQTDNVIQGYVKDRINPMIADHAGLRARLGLNAVDDSLHYKRFQGMRVEFLAAAYANMISKKAPRIVVDELDAYSPSLGDVLALLSFRRQTFGRDSMLLAMSHCDRALGLNPAQDWGAGIMAAYRDSDRHVWYWPCPECGLVSSPLPTAKWVMHLDYPANGTLDEIAAKTVLVCPHNGCVIHDHQRRAMNVAAFNAPWGGWVGAGQDISAEGEITGQLIRSDAAGFWMHGVMSPFLLSGIGGLARAVVKAEREIESGETDTAHQSRRDAYVKGLGVPPPPLKRAGSVDAKTLAERAEPDFRLGTVPDGARFLTAFVDVQSLYFDVMVRGWGPGCESWIVDRFKIVLSTLTSQSNGAGDPVPVDPAHEPADWDAMLTRLTRARYPLASDPTRGMVLRAIGYDTGGAPGVTTQAYAAWLRWRKSTLERGAPIRAYGEIGGRPVFSIMPMRGQSHVRAQRLMVVWPDSQRKDRKVVTRGEMPLAQFNPDSFKTEMAGHLGKAEPGDWYVHFPAQLGPEFYEQLVAESVDKAGKWTKIKPNAKNEALDQMVGTHVLAHLHGLTRIKWDRPHPWCAPHAENTLVAPMESALEKHGAAPPKKPKAPLSFAMLP